MKVKLPRFMWPEVMKAVTYLYNEFGVFTVVQRERERVYVVELTLLKLNTYSKESQTGGTRLG